MKLFRTGGALAAIVLALPPAGPAAADTFAYDALGRVITVNSDTGATRSYGYDAADNLLTMTVSAGGGGALAANAAAGLEPAGRMALAQAPAPAPMAARAPDRSGSQARPPAGQGA